VFHSESPNRKAISLPVRWVRGRVQGDGFGYQFRIFRWLVEYKPGEAADHQPKIQRVYSVKGTR